MCGGGDRSKGAEECGKFSWLVNRCRAVYEFLFGLELDGGEGGSVFTDPALPGSSSATC